MNIINKITRFLRNENNSFEKEFNSNLGIPGFGVAYMNWHDLTYRSNYSLTQLIQGLPMNIMRFIASDIATATPVMFRKTDAMDNEQLNQHEFIDLLLHPSSEMTANELYQTICLHRWIYGTAFPVVLRGVKYRKPKEIVLVHPMQVQIIRDSNNNITGIEDRITGNRFERNQIIGPVKNINIANNSFNTNYFFGTSIIYENELTFSLYQSQLRYQERQLMNDAQINFILLSDRKYSADSKRTFLEQWNAQFAGPNNARKTAFLDEGIKPFATSWNAKDLDFISGRKETEKAIMKPWALPGDMLGDSSTVNRSTGQQNTLNYYKNVLLPEIHIIDSAFNKYIYNQYPKENIFIRHLLPRIENIDALKEFELGLKGGLTWNEYRKYMGYAPLPGLNTPVSLNNITNPNSNNDVNTEDNNINDNTDVSNDNIPNE